eukprot:m.180028 g.180028  ORF g.180028 m.180028 type:complete len:617 (-) comp21456_c0_seq6:26-1876(-)
MLFVRLLLLSGCALADFYVSIAHGNDANPGTSLPQAFKTLARAQTAVRAAAPKAPLSVFIDSGVYQLDSTWTFDASDSGPDGGYVHWQALPGAQVNITGGVVLSGWKSTKHPLLAGSVLSVDISHLPQLQSRHLFVNNRRAQRTSSTDMTLFTGSVLNDQGFLLTAAQGAAALAWKNPSEVELLWEQNTSPWTTPRCCVQNVTKIGSGGVQLALMQPCWTNLKNKACGQTAHSPPTSLENLGLEHLTTPGQFYVDTPNKMLYYMPRDGEQAATIRAVFPVLEELLVGRGKPTSPIKNIKFSGLNFEYATWRRPSQGDGYVEMQSGCCVTGTDPRNSVCDDDFIWHKSPGNLAFHTSHGIVFDGCVFNHFGGVALDFGDGAHANIVQNCLFLDSSGAAVQIGSFGTYAETDPLKQDLYNVVNNTIVRNAAVEYNGAVGINIGYTKGTIVTHCDVGNLTYGSFSMGWGWSRHPQTYAANNTVSFNRFHDYKRVMNDGGGIYTLGPQNGTVVHDNWVYNQGTAGTGGLYPDEGSAYMHWFSNVVTSMGKGEWLHIWTASIHNITVQGNFHDTTTMENHGTNCPVIDDTLFPPGKPPAAAQAIMDASGVKNSPFQRWVDL